MSSEQSHDASSGTFIRWVNRHNMSLTAIAAAVPAILYLFFVDRYATNSFDGDDWSVVLFVHAALHNQLSLGQLWSQYNESRLFLGNIVDIGIGFADRLSLRTVILFSAAVFIASYAVLLVLFREYLGKRLTPVPVVVLGITWFSLADVQNSLWAFQVSWYLTVLFLVIMLFALLVPEHHHKTWFAVAALVAFAASLSTVQGFLLWPLGAICFLWKQPFRRSKVQVPNQFRTSALKGAAWIGATLVTVALYIRGYNFNNNGCYPPTTCKPAVALHHPWTTLRFFFALIGDVIPSGSLETASQQEVIRFVIVGVGLFAVAALILIRSWRNRLRDEDIPLPFTLISFALVFDISIALGRSGIGLHNTAPTNRYVMPNLILLIGILIYALVHIQPVRRPAVDGGRRVNATWLLPMALALFIVIQATTATDFGLVNGRATARNLTSSARFFVNQDHVPRQDRLCEEDLLLTFQPGAMPSFALKLHDAAEDKLGEFRPNSNRYYRRLGPPPLFPSCSVKSPS